MSATTVTVTVPIRSIVKHFESLPDPRHTCNRLHLLADGLSIAVCGVIVGCSGPSAIERWAKAKKEWLKEVLALPNGIPSRDCIRRILCALKPEAFQNVFSIVDGEPVERRRRQDGRHRWQGNAPFA